MLKLVESYEVLVKFVMSDRGEEEVQCGFQAMLRFDILHIGMCREVHTGPRWSET